MRSAEKVIPSHPARAFLGTTPGTSTDPSRGPSATRWHPGRGYITRGQVLVRTTRPSL